MISIAEDLSTLNNIPDCPGVYLFYSDKDELPIYIGKSINLRKRVRSHFYQAKSNSKEKKLTSRTNHIDFHTTIGEIEALLLESKLIKAKLPLLNKRLRRHKSIFSISAKSNNKSNAIYLETISCNTESFIPNSNQYGMFRSKRESEELIEKLIKENKLCKKMLGIEKTSKSCFNYQLQRCCGACCSIISIEEHNKLILESLGKYKHKNWPYPGTIGIIEQNTKEKIIHYVNQWVYYGSQKFKKHAKPPKNFPQGRACFNLDEYKIIMYAMKSKNVTKILLT